MLIDELKEKQAKLSAALQDCTDDKAYDQISAELASVTKTITLAENRERQRIKDEAEAKRKAELAKYNAELKRIEKARKDANALDADLFEKIAQAHTAFYRLYDMKLQNHQDTNDLRVKARELGLEEPEQEPVTICNIVSYKSKEDHFLEMIGQYDSSARYIANAKRRGKKAPDRPEMSWYAKGAGQYWD